MKYKENRKQISANIPYTIGKSFSLAIIPKFYNLIIRRGYSKFNTLNSENLEKLDIIATNWREFYALNNKVLMLELASTTAGKFITLPKDQFPDPNEILYTYIKIVDPTLKVLRLANECQTPEEIEQTLKAHFGWFDKTLLRFEEHLNKRLALLDTVEFDTPGRK